MLIEPRAGALLRRLADCLAAGTDARQQKAAVWLLRDLARRLDGHAAAVRQDLAAMETLLRAHGVAPAAAQGSDEDTHLARQRQLHQLQVQRRNDPALLALFLEQLERERALLGPPGGNPSLKDSS